MIDSSTQTKFCFSHSIILTATTCIAHYVSSDSAMGKTLASTLFCSYPKLQQMKKMSFNLFPPGSFVTYFDQQHQSFIYNVVTERRFFLKTAYETLEKSLQALKQHLTRHNIQELAIAKLGCGYDQFHWPTVFQFYSKFFRVQTLL